MSPVFTSFIGPMRSAVMSEQMSQLWDNVVFLYPSALPVPQSKTVFLESGFKPSAD